MKKRWRTMDLRNFPPFEPVRAKHATGKSLIASRSRWKSVIFLLKGYVSPR